MLARAILKIAGWKISPGFLFEHSKCIVIEAPHTSMWDFIWGWMAFQSIGVRVRFLIKKELFFFPMGPLLKWMGAIPVDRKKSSNMVDFTAQLFSRYDNLVITITPEGTRKRVENWKKGFYYIAMRAKVPIVLGYLDYGKKEGGAGPVIFPSGNYEEDWKVIEAFYRGRQARHPEKFNL